MISFKKRIIVVREPISGLLGIHSLYGLVKSKIAFTQGESLYVVFFTKNHRRIKVLHIDAAGVDLTTRFLFKGIFMSDTSTDDYREINVEALQRLLFDGTLPDTPWQNPLAQVMFMRNEILTS